MSNQNRAVESELNVIVSKIFRQGACAAIGRQQSLLEEIERMRRESGSRKRVDLNLILSKP